MTPRQCNSFTVSLQDPTMLHFAPSLTSVTSVQPFCFKSVILAWQHKTADFREIWQRQTGSNYGALSPSKLCESFNSRNISVLLCEDGNTAPVYRGYQENEVICTIKSIVHNAQYNNAQCLVHKQHPKNRRVITNHHHRGMAICHSQTGLCPEC